MHWYGNVEAEWQAPIVPRRDLHRFWIESLPLVFLPSLSFLPTAPWVVLIHTTSLFSHRHLRRSCFPPPHPTSMLSSMERTSPWTDTHSPPWWPYLQSAPWLIAKRISNAKGLWYEGMSAKNLWNCKSLILDVACINMNCFEAEESFRSSYRRLCRLSKCSSDWFP